MSPKGENWTKAVEFWRTLYSDKDCKFDKEVNIDGKNIEPLVTWGTSPQDVSPVTGVFTSRCITSYWCCARSRK